MEVSTTYLKSSSSVVFLLRFVRNFSTQTFEVSSSRILMLSPMNGFHKKTIRELIAAKKSAEEQLNIIKGKLLSDMEEKDVRSWVTETMRITRKLPTTRSSFDLKAFKADNPNIDLSAYMKTSDVAGSLSIAI